MKKFKNFLEVLGTIILIFIFTAPFFGFLFKKIYEGISGGKIGSCVGITIFCFKHPEYFEGFFISYSFFVTLALTIFGGKKKYLTLAILLGLIFIIQIVVPESLIVSAGAAIVAWLIGQLILFIKKRSS